MNKREQLIRRLLAVGLIGMMSALSAGVVFHEDFQTLEAGSEPDYPKFLVLDGNFTVKQEGENKFLELPGAPLDSFGMMFGPSEFDGFSVSARIRGSKRGRMPSPVFGLGLNGGGGVRLKVNGTRKSLELHRGEVMLERVDYRWESGKWLNVRLAVRRAGEAWKAFAKVWSDGSTEPDDWSIETLLKEKPYLGKASIFGSPFSGTPIAFDDLKVEIVPLALQTWSIRNMNFDQAVAFAEKNGFTKLQMARTHMDPKDSREVNEKKKAVLDDKELQVYTYGVANTTLDKEEDRKLFEFAKFMEIDLIVVEPPDFKTFEHLEELVEEYNIRIGIHNHGIKTLYGNPLVVQNVIKHLDPRIGVCLDTGWITAAGFDPAEVYKNYEGRVFDIHLKDKKIERTQGGDVFLDVEIGTGDANLSSLFQLLRSTGYSGYLAIETDNATFAKNPQPFIGKAIDYVHVNFP